MVPSTVIQDVLHCISEQRRTAGAMPLRGTSAHRKQAPPHLQTQAEELALLQQLQREIHQSVCSMSTGMQPTTERKVQHQAPEAANSARVFWKPWDKVDESGYGGSDLCSAPTSARKDLRQTIC